MSELTTIARPYATAAFEFAVEAKAIDAMQAQLVFAAEVSKNDTVQALLTGSTNADTLADIFIKVCDEQLDKNGQNLIKVMAENKRLFALPEVVKLFAELKAEYEKTVEVDVFSATELSAEQQEKLVASLEKRLAKKVKLNCQIDTNLIGGLRVKAGDIVIDSTVRGKLDRLATSLQS
ncbi:F0F1 ATP synthase subunit delta [Saccharobesus litoralis]|uniref:ATP synthase subunit delta n=1 Tax=Saccharobesus litoralis TaxID=2172099 RepID=A0A2S0VQC9_9ALTE|nr:F0F1 ATP synthase subunit delta [Saccharobesus litoralis]AWB66418.1 F0F1 ATP synthase subunit delta [Saccharobesus litoralis]